jgi:hypothetical protein
MILLSGDFLFDGREMYRYYDEPARNTRNQFLLSFFIHFLSSLHVFLSRLSRLSRVSLSLLTPHFCRNPILERTLRLGTGSGQLLTKRENTRTCGKRLLLLLCNDMILGDGALT